MPKGRDSFYTVEPIVLWRMLGGLVLLVIFGGYYVGQTTGLFAPLFENAQLDEEQRRALAARNAEVKRMIAARQARAAEVQAAELAAQREQAERDLAAKPAAQPSASATPEPSAEPAATD